MVQEISPQALQDLMGGSARFALIDVREPGEYNSSHGVVHDIAYLGGHSVYYIKLDSGKMVQAFFANSERRLPRPTWEDEVYISWEDDSGVILHS